MYKRCITFFSAAWVRGTYPLSTAPTTTDISICIPEHTSTTTVDRMEQLGEEVPMSHYQCHTCGMTATVAVTPVSELAWLDHMEQHGAKKNYSCWKWTVVPLWAPDSEVERRP